MQNIAIRRFKQGVSEDLHVTTRLWPSSSPTN
jgi:hypothetical protein